jgi:hypothetical protein
MHLNIHKNYRVQGRCGSAFKRASEAHAQEKFPGEYPRFTKCMVPSNVLRVFWLVSLCLLNVCMFKYDQLI